MDLPATTFAGFLDELSKIASSDKWTVAKSRTGTRPISVDNLVKKHNEGELFREKVADAAGNPQDVHGDSVDDPGAAKLPKRPGEVPSKEVGIPMQAKTGSPLEAVFRAFERYMAQAKLGYVYGDVTPFPNGEQTNFQPEARKPRKRGDVPSKDDSNIIDRYDNRDSATTVHGIAQNSQGIGASNQPAEYT